MTGLSVEFRAVRERRDGDLRVVEDAILSGIAIVRSPSYGAARVEARRRSGRTMLSRIPAGRKLECRCAGAACKFARVTGDALRDEFELAFGQARKEIIAGFGSYDMPLASLSSVTTMSQKSSVMQLPQFVPKALTSDNVRHQNKWDY